SDARSCLYRAHILRRGHGGAGQHDRHADRGHHPWRRGIDCAEHDRCLLGAGHFVCNAARGPGDPAAGPARQAIMSRNSIVFSIATIAVTIVIETSVTNWRFVGGAAGIQIQRPAVMPPFNNYAQMLFFVQALLVVLAVTIARYIQISWIGRGLQALKDDELAA